MEDKMKFLKESAFISKSSEFCDDCCAVSDVFGISSLGFESFEDDVDFPIQNLDGFVSFAHITYLCDELISSINKLTRDFHLDKAEGESVFYYYNHCQYCGATISDNILYHSDGALMPLDYSGAKNVTLFKINNENTLALCGGENMTSPSFVPMHSKIIEL